MGRMPDKLTTERLALRLPEEGDLDAVAAMNADAEVARHVSLTGPLTRAESWRYLALLRGHWAFRGYGQYAVTRRGDGAFVGVVGLHEPEGWPSLEIGWRLAPAMWGQGYGTEAALRVRDEAFACLGVEFLISLVRPGNVRSAALARRIGAARERSMELFGAEVDVWRTGRP